MAETPALTIRRDWPRPDPALVADLTGTPTGFVVDALGRSGALDYRLRPLFPAEPFIGAALTVASTACDNLAPYAALKVARPGDVMLIATGDFSRAAVIGDVIVGMMRNAGVVAAITDGLARDVAGLAEVGIPVYARGLSPNSPFKNGPGSIGLPITIGGVVVTAGDIILGDRDGIAVVPLARAREVIDALAAIRKKEVHVDAAVKAGLACPDWLDEALEAKGVRWI